MRHQIALALGEFRPPDVEDQYDPGLGAICREVFGDTVLKYTKPQTRLSGHLAGYDPTTAPKVEWPERLVKAKDEIRRQAKARDAAANAAPNAEK